MENVGLNLQPFEDCRNVSHDFWVGKRVLITGHTGFKGSWLSIWLQKMGAEITGFSLAPPTQPNLFELAKVADGMNSINGDVRDLSALARVFRHAKPEIVIHMAAQPLVRYSYEHPIETYSTNVMGTVNVLEAARHSGGVKVIVNVTTDKCYENREWIWSYREDMPLGGFDPYSSSKACSELVTSAFRNSYFNREEYCKHGVAVASARAGNVIGGGDWASDRLVPDVIAALSKGESISIRNPNAIRPWQHVLDPLSGYLLLAESLYKDGVKFAEAWNFGPRDIDAKPVGWIVDRLIELWGDGGSRHVFPGCHPHEANLLALDITKARLCLGWQPKWSLNVALKSIIEWQKKLNTNTPIRTIVQEQINEFVGCA